MLGGFEIIPSLFIYTLVVTYDRNNRYVKVYQLFRHTLKKTTINYLLDKNMKHPC